MYVYPRRLFPINDFVWTSPVSIQSPALISYCSPVQGEKARVCTSVYEFISLIIGQVVYREQVRKHVSGSL